MNNGAAPATRRESDSLGTLEVPADRYWGAQTERARHHFAIGGQRMPVALVRAYGIIKQAAALANHDLGGLDEERRDLIVAAAEEVADGRLDDHFPLTVWVSGSGTQTNMNVNEVVANRAIEMAGGEPGSRDPVHPNDHVNRSQSSNDTFPTAMQVAAARLVRRRLMPSLGALEDCLRAKARVFDDVTKIGRTHLQDAVPLTLGDEIGGWAGQVAAGKRAVADALPELYPVPLGGTAVGTGLNAPPGFGPAAAARLGALLDIPFTLADDRFARIASHDSLVRLSGALRDAAQALFKMANDVRWLASGPRCGLGELQLPANEPGSSIMPGKVNPTQCEALMQVCTRVMGHDAAAGFAGSQGNLELSVFKPVIAASVLESAELLADACDSFRRYALAGLDADRRRIEQHLDNSLMLVTALVPVVGYDAAARAAHFALEEEVTLRDACLAMGLLDGATFDRLTDPAAMARPYGPEDDPVAGAAAAAKPDSDSEA